MLLQKKKRHAPTLSIVFRTGGQVFMWGIGKATEVQRRDDMADGATSGSIDA